MAAPEHVPVDRRQLVRSYEAPPRRPDSWLARRPGDLPTGQPEGNRFGHQGPDQGYALLLARRFEGKLTLTEGEDEQDVLFGAVLVALKRASILGRAPVLPDLTVALTIWGFLADAPEELVDLRRQLFEEVASRHHYVEQRRLVDIVPEAVLRMTPAQVTEAARRDWRSLLSVESIATA